jgi:rubrerythrin
VGGRSRSAANYLSHLNFDAATMKGGFDAWNGLVSTAEVNQGIYLIEGNESAEELLALAYGLEAETGKLYAALSGQMEDMETKEMFRMLAGLEEQHKKHLWERYSNATEGKVLKEHFEKKIVTGILEQGKSTDEMLTIYTSRILNAADALEMTMSLETDAFDLYLRMAVKVSDEEAKKLFYYLSEEEKFHLKHLAELFRRAIKS